jgi:CsoR family transcriptional regulator, copper-sensing transcriptional repressor
MTTSEHPLFHDADWPQDAPTADDPTAITLSAADRPGHSHGPGEHRHIHSEESQRRIVNRLSRLEGHIRGIKAMVQEGRPCPDVLVQIAAVRGALNRAGRMILDEHLTECVARAAEAGTIDAELEELKAALDRFLA